jgi:type I restriction enzyme S subunit
MSKLDELIKELCPDGVEYKNLGEISRIVRGASPRPIKDFITDDEDGVNWVKIGDVAPGSKYITETKERITVEGAKKSRFVRKGDFVLSNSMSFGRPYILRIDGCIHDGWLVISGYERVFNQDYLYYLLSAPFSQVQFNDLVSTSLVSNLNSKKVSTLLVMIPPLAEQQRIVDALASIESKLVRLGEC